MQIIPFRISWYISKIFLMRLLILIFSLGFLIFIINMMEVSQSAQDVEVGGLVLFTIVLFQIPQWIEFIMPFLIMIASILTFNKLSMSNELSIVRAGGVSVWQFLFPVILCVVVIGIIGFALFNSFSANLNARSEFLYDKYIENVDDEDEKSYLEPKNGIWFKQADVENEGGEIIFRASSVNKENLLFKDVVINYFDTEKMPVKRMSAEIMILKEAFWKLEKVTILEEGKNSVNKDLLLIGTDLQENFVLSTINNSYENPERVGFWRLPRVINAMQESGLSAQRFKIQFYSLLMRPILFLAIVLISSYFSLNHARSNTNPMMITFGIIAGFLIYFTSDIMIEFGKMEKVSFFVSTWMMTVLYLVIGLVLVIKKEE
jgi:lipopolysaccharide export system permease protein